MLSAALSELVNLAVIFFLGWVLTLTPPKSRLLGIIFTAPGISVTVALAVLLGSATDAAMIVTAGGVGTAFGAA